MDAFDKSGADTVYGNLVYVDPNNTNRIVRYWRAGQFYSNNMKKGWMPPHTALFVKKDAYELYGRFNTSYKIASDYDMVLRLFLKHKVSTYYLDYVIVRMRLGGLSNRSFQNIILKLREDYSVSRAYGFGFSTLLMKNIVKIPQLFVK
jgi:glycosyltransferase